MARKCDVPVSIAMAQAGVREYDKWIREAEDNDYSMGGIIHPASTLVVEIYKAMEKVRVEAGRESLPPEVPSESRQVR